MILKLGSTDIELCNTCHNADLSYNAQERAHFINHVNILWKAASRKSRFAVWKKVVAELLMREKGRVHAVWQWNFVVNTNFVFQYDSYFIVYITRWFTHWRVVAQWTPTKRGTEITLDKQHNSLSHLLHTTLYCQHTACFTCKLYCECELCCHSSVSRISLAAIYWNSWSLLRPCLWFYRVFL